jgi:hypothetical protein
MKKTAALSVMWTWICMRQHHYGKPDPDPHQGKKLDPGPHHSKKPDPDPDPHQSDVNPQH